MKYMYVMMNNWYDEFWQQPDIREYPRGIYPRATKAIVVYKPCIFMWLNKGRMNIANM